MWGDTEVVPVLADISQQQWMLRLLLKYVFRFKAGITWA